MVPIDIYTIDILELVQQPKSLWGIAMIQQSHSLTSINPYPT